jgi:hypothetical protein
LTDGIGTVCSFPLGSGFLCCFLRIGSQILSDVSGPVWISAGFGLVFLDSSGFFFRTGFQGQVFRLSDKGSGSSGRIGLVVSGDKGKKKLTDIGFLLEILLDIG